MAATPLLALALASQGASADRTSATQDDHGEHGTAAIATRATAMAADRAITSRRDHGEHGTTAAIATRATAMAADRAATPRGNHGEHAAATGASAADGAATAAGPGGAALAPRAALARQLEDEAGSVERALAAVDDKLAAADLTRSHRLIVALRVVRGAPGNDAAVEARRRAAARLLLERDRGERALLVDESAQLRAARTRIAGEAAELPALALPGELARPAPGKIARHFGALAHERSKATLSRRGIDIEVDDHSPVVAPAAGTVRYAGPIRGLDHGVILDHGDYLTVIGKLREVALPVGAPIAAGDRLGRAARRRVYLEVRVKLGPGGLPIDPEPLLAPAADSAAASARPARPAPARSSRPTR